VLFDLNGSLRVDNLPDSHPTDATSSTADLPPECRHPELDLRANCPHRPVDWRWQIACRFAIKGFNLRFQDWHLYWAVRFRWALLQWEDELFGKNSRDNAAAALNAAYEVYHAGSGPARWELEARILANEPAESIGQRFNLSTEAVDWYEALFFNVRDCLKATGYVTHTVIRSHDPWQGLPSDLGRLWKVIGYYRGPEALDEMIGFTAPPPAANKVELHKYLEEQTRRAINCKAFVAIEMVPLDDPKTAMKFVKLWVRMLEIESREQRRRQTGPEVDITLNIRCFLEKLNSPVEATWYPGNDQSAPVVAEPPVVSPSPPADAAQCPSP
jgi:hypothetical protein